MRATVSATRQSTFACAARASMSRKRPARPAPGDAAAPATRKAGSAVQSDGNAPALTPSSAPKPGRRLTPQRRVLPLSARLVNVLSGPPTKIPSKASLAARTMSMLPSGVVWTSCPSGASTRQTAATQRLSGSGAATAMVLAPSLMDLDQPDLKSVRTAKPRDALALAEIERGQHAARPARLGESQRRVEVGDPKRRHEPRRARQKRDVRTIEQRLIMLGEPPVFGKRERYAKLVA